MIRKMNKRGDIAITLLVLLVVFVSAYTLFTFVKNKNQIGDMLNSGYFINELVSQKYQKELTIDSLLDQAFAKTYKEFVEQGAFYDGGTTFINLEEKNIAVLDKLKDNWQNDFLENYRNNVDSLLGYKVYKLQGAPPLRFESSFEVSLEDNNFIYKTSSVVFGRSSVTPRRVGWSDVWDSEVTSIKISSGGSTGRYYGNYILKRNFESFGLHGFDELVLAKEECIFEKTKDTLQECFSLMLKNFNVEVKTITKGDGNSKKVYTIASLSSKKSFLIDDSLQKIQFSFIFDER